MDVPVTCVEVLNHVIKKENIIKPTIKVLSGSKPGDGYVAINLIVDIIGENKTLKLFVKTAPNDAEFRNKEPIIRKFFFAECVFYQKIYPGFLKFLSDKKYDKIFYSVPKCYTAVSEELKEVIVLENLAENRYRLWDRRLTMPQDHIEFVLKEFSQLHAISFAMKDQNKQMFEEISKDVRVANEGLFDGDDCKNLLKYLVNIAKTSLDAVEDKGAYDTFEKFGDEILPFLNQMHKFVDDEYLIIVHGDAWCNNLMFKYEDIQNSTRPTSMRFLDWQIMRKSTPVLDISYFFYSSSSKKEMDNLEYFLQLYYGNLASNIRRLGSDPNLLYPYAKLKEHWKKYCRYGLIWGMLVLKIMLTETDEVASINDIAAKRENMCEHFKIEIKNDKVYKARLREVIVHFVNNGFLELLNIV